MCEDQRAGYFRKTKEQMQSFQVGKSFVFLWNSKKAMEAEAHFLQIRKGGHRMASTARNPTGSCSVSLTVKFIKTVDHVLFSLLRFKLKE